MPKAIRKTQIASKPDRYGAEPVVPRATWDRMKNFKGNGVDALPRSSAFIAAMDGYHHALAQVSGTMVLAFGKSGLSADAARAMIDQLRAIADGMERTLFKG